MSIIDTAALKGLLTTALELEAQRDRYEAALRRIADWKGYGRRASDNEGNVVVTTQYEDGANGMLTILKQIAEEALR